MEQRELLNKLFTWTRSLDLKNPAGDVIMRVYQRLAGDTDVQKARMLALRYSRELRLKLRNHESDEYIALIQPVEDLDRDSLITLLLVDSIDVVKRELDQTFYFAEPPEPGEFDTTEKHEEYAAKWSSWEEDREKAYSAKLVAAMDVKKEEFSRKATEELVDIAKRTRIDALCDQELKLRFIEICTVLGTYDDDRYSRHLYDSYPEFSNQPEALKSQLVSGYAELEMSTISLKESTKSPASEPESPSLPD